MLPTIIQGGMGVAISDWKLAKAVSLEGQLGVVSGTGLTRVLVSRLMDGDAGGHVRRALDSFPFKDWSEKIYDKYFVEGGKRLKQAYKNTPLYTESPTKMLDAITVVANYVEVFLAKEGHDGKVGINLLEKIQIPTMASLYGAMLAGVDYVLMGAGIPTQVAGILDKLTKHEDTEYRLDVEGANKEDHFSVKFSARKVFGDLVDTIKLNRPKFLPIISSVVLGKALISRSDGEIDGFVIEAPIAGGHNAPPRKPSFNEKGEPVYGPRDEVDFAQIAELGKPFWLAGGYGNKDGLKKALDAGAQGIQVGSAFALCEDSGLRPDLKKASRDGLIDGTLEIYTDAKASPTGFPFKVAQMEGTMSDMTLRTERERVCDIGLLRSAYRTEDGKLGWRCPAAPESGYVNKGGNIDACEGRTCLCNNLMATAGFPQQRKDGYEELPLVTLGNDVVQVTEIMKEFGSSYSAANVVRYLEVPVMA